MRKKSGGGLVMMGGIGVCGLCGYCGDEIWLVVGVCRGGGLRVCWMGGGGWSYCEVKSGMRMDKVGVIFS